MWKTTPPPISSICWFFSERGLVFGNREHALSQGEYGVLGSAGLDKFSDSKLDSALTETVGRHKWAVGSALYLRLCGSYDIVFLEQGTSRFLGIVVLEFSSESTQGPALTPLCERSGAGFCSQQINVGLP